MTASPVNHTATTGLDMTEIRQELPRQRSPLEIKIVSRRSVWRVVVDFVKDVAALLAFVTAAAAFFLPQVEFAKLINIFTGIGESANPPTGDVAFAVTAEDQIAPSLSGWTYLGKADNSNAWNYARVDGRKEIEPGIWKAQTPVNVRVSPVTALVPSPELLGVVNEGSCFAANEVTVNDRTQSIWLNGRLVSSC